MAKCGNEKWFTCDECPTSCNNKDGHISSAGHNAKCGHDKNHQGQHQQRVFGTTHYWRRT